MKEKKRNAKSCRQLWFMLFSLFLTANVYAQKIEVTGTVVDQNGETMIGVSVQDVKTSMGTITDLDGKFHLKADKGTTLKFSYIGYKEQLIKVSSGVIKVVMTEDSEQLEEVVVVGYGTQKKGSVTGSITSVDAKTIEDIPAASLANALAGRLSGVSISTSTGKPGATSSFSIRAKGTINNSDPLYVIDGVIRDKEAFDALDASEVANISVLKDGASAAVYGARAANGVVLITTKKGGSSKPTINYSGTIGIESPTIIPETLTAYEHAKYLNDQQMVIWKNGGQQAADPRTSKTWFTDDELEYFRTHEDYSYIDAAWKTPFTTRHSLNVTGGNDRFRYFIGGAYYYATGSFENLKYNKYNFRASIDADITKNFTVGLNISTDNRYDRKPFWPSDNDRDSMDNLYLGFILRSKMTPGMIDGKYVQHNGQEQNPLALISEEHGSHTKKHLNINTNFFAEYKVPFVEGLKLKLQYNRTTNNSLTKRVSLPYTMYNFKSAGENGHLIDPSHEIVGSYEHKLENYVRKIESLRGDYQLNFFVTYNRTFGKHDVSGVFVYEQSEGNSESFDARRNNLITWTIPEFFAASSDAANSTVGSGSLSETGRLSYVGRVNYAYDEKYLVEAAFRVDGSTKFAPAKRWGFFPSISLGWRISSEPFWKKNVKFIDYMKLRGSVATLGNDAIGGWDWMPKYNIKTGAVFGSQSYGVEPGTIANEDLTWEKSTSYNIGFDSKWFNNHIDFSFEYFYRHTYDILDERAASVPTTFGASLPKENYSVIDSQGFEFELAYNGKYKDFRYWLRGNFGYAKSWWVKRDEAANMRPYLSEIGQPVGRVWGYECTGIIRTQEQLDAILAENPNMTVLGQKPVLGMLMYKDVRGTVSDEPDGIITSDDKVVIRKHTSPPVNYGFSLGGNWKGFTLDIFFQGVAGNKKIVSERFNKLKEWNSTFAIKADHWSYDNPNGAFPCGNDNKNKEMSTFWTYNGSFLRCKNITLAYDLPKRVLEPIGAQKAKIFVNGTNLFLLEDHLKWQDPEINNIGSYPIMRNFSLGVNVTF